MMPNRKAAFRRMHEKHFDAIARYCLRRLPAIDAHDATSEVSLLAWSKFSSISDADETLLWLYGIARNVVRNLQRLGRRSARLRARVGSESSYPAPAPEVQIIRHEENAMILAALARFRPDDREVIHARRPFIPDGDHYAAVEGLPPVVPMRVAGFIVDPFWPRAHRTAPGGDARLARLQAHPARRGDSAPRRRRGRQGIRNQNPHLRRPTPRRHPVAVGADPSP
jgi:hypothetical protein